MKTTPTIIALASILLVLSPVPGRAQGKGKMRAPADPNAAPVWVLPPVEGANLHYRKFQSVAVKGEVSYVIYLPEEYEKKKEARYPVVYWLHGKGGSQQGLPGFARGFNDAITAGKCPPLLVVYANGLPLGGYTDSPDGKRPVESCIIQDLIPHIDATFRTVATREGRMIEGFSMGGSGTAKFGFKYPDLFGSISIFAAALRPADAQSSPSLLAEKNADKVRGRTPLRIAVGSRDPLLGKNTEFHELLDRLKIEHEFTVIDGAPHSPAPVYAGLGDKNWAFYVKAFKAANPSK